MRCIAINFVYENYLLNMASNVKQFLNTSSQTWFAKSHVACQTFLYRSSVATQTFSVNIDGLCFEKVIYVLRNVDEFATLHWQVRCI